MLHLGSLCYWETHLPPLSYMPPRIQMAGGTVSATMKRDMRGSVEQGEGLLWCVLSFAHCPLWKGRLEQATSTVPRLNSRCYDGRRGLFRRHVLALSGELLHLPCSGLSHFGTETPTSWEIPVAPSKLDGWLPFLGRRPLCWEPHTKCHLSEAERPTDLGIPPLAEPGTPTFEESC